MEKKERSSTIDQYIMHVVRNECPETVEQLIQTIRTKQSENLDFPVPEQELMKRILDLQNQGKLALREYSPRPLPTLTGYIKKATWYWTIVALTITTTLAAFLIPPQVFPLVYVRYVLGAPFVLFLPGYCLIKALFLGKELDNIERLALSLGLSLALVSLTGLLLNFTPLGIRQVPLILSLLALTTLFATAALIREHEAILKEVNPPN